MSPPRRTSRPPSSAPAPQGSGAPACEPDGHCITCSDEGIPMRVLSADADAGLATCEDGSGARSDVMTALVGDVVPGDRLLVHAGTALLRLEGSA